ncbi:magnesium-translocating P-type ATPase [New Jersey aster yellows phytoplasma]|uniref:Magnesium-transporting ATPase, P-type 1 n=1 Tax=New Jersey aster yellows phytoplasma TaxID=270520 RepID=A0ABX4K2K1_9MOLU|nr:magnesium-translocating P-type ATPase [New Jersey aster yellows phytoplasma]PEH36338.1 magnesium-translocating P-type ATPase [New Jersey aster yellows phytoplasma]
MKKVNLKRQETIDFLKTMSQKSQEKTLQTLNSSLKGLDQKQVMLHQSLYGKNILSQETKTSFTKQLLQIAITPFNIVLLILTLISLFNDVLTPSQENRSYSTVITTILMFLGSVIVQFSQESKHLKITSQLKTLVQNTTAVKRNNFKMEIALEEVVRGDIVILSAGDVIPADIKLLETKDFFVKTTTFTGESEPVEKMACSFLQSETILDDPKLVLAGSTVISGYATGIALVTGKDTYLGNISQEITKKKSLSHLDQSINTIAKLLMICICLMAPLVFLFNFYKPQNTFLQSFLFALTIAFGLTPKMLPLIVATSFSKGIVALSKRKVIVKNLNAISSFGAMNILFTDKTGTLTEDQIFLENFLDLNGNEDIRVLRHAYLNSFFQTGLKSLIDKAIITKTNNAKTLHPSLQGITAQFTKIDEIPFDFKRRKMSVVIQDASQKQQMITKGAIEEILSICDHVELEGKVVPLSDQSKQIVLQQTITYNQKGYRVVGVAQKLISNPKQQPCFTPGQIEEKSMVLIGLLTFLDPIKESSTQTISSLQQKGIIVKILTGDNDILTKAIAQKLNIQTTYCLQGSVVDNLSDDALYEASQKTNLFTKLSPEQKARIVSVFKQKGNIVAFMGDGINDASAMKQANLGICVDSGAEITKEIADIILLEKQLTVLEQGVLEGRKTYTNALKYIKFTLSSNFANSLSILLASLCLNFQPMIVLQVLFLDLIYDLICFAIPFDNVDDFYLQKPCKWDFASIKSFMLWFGFCSFLLDFAFLIGMKFLLKNLSQNDRLFQTSWFIFSMWSQTLTIFLLRTDKIIAKNNQKNLPSFLIMVCCCLGLIITTFLPLIPIVSQALHLDQSIFEKTTIFPFLLFLVVIYSLVMIWAKKIFIQKHKQLL